MSMTQIMMETGKAHIKGCGHLVNVTDAEKKEADAALRRMAKKWDMKNMKTTF